jgi:uracil-DNA glycosylase
VTKQRGEFLEPDFAPLATATVHPSSILRIDDEDERRQARHDFVRDLRKVAKRLAPKQGVRG